MLFGLWAQMGPGNHAVDGGPQELRDVAMATIFDFLWGAHWRRLVNTTEPSVCGGDAALCQITLTTCYCSCYHYAVVHRNITPHSCL